MALEQTAREGSNTVLNSSPKNHRQLSRGHTKWCDTFQESMAAFQFMGCGDSHSQKEALQQEDVKMLDGLRAKLNATLPRTGNTYDKTIGKSLSTDDIRALSLTTAVTWLSNGGSNTGWTYFKLLCVKAFSLYAFSNCRRSVLTWKVLMVNLWAHAANSQQLQSLEEACSAQYGVPLMVYAAGSDKDKVTDTVRDKPDSTDIPPAYVPLVSA